MKKYIYLIILSLQSAMAMAASKIDFSGCDVSSVGIVVVDLSDGRVVSSENPDKAMVPASILKCVTSAASLSINGGSYRYKTVVNLEGTLSASRLEGDIVVTASGDPTIDSQYMVSSRGFCDSIVSNLKRLGVKTIAGDIVVDEGDAGGWGQNGRWSIDDAACGYGTGVYNFNFKGNVFRYFPASGKSDPEIPFLDVQVVPSKGGIEVSHGINSDFYIVEGKALYDPKTAVTLPMNSPATVFTHFLKRKLDENGIKVLGADIVHSDVITPLYTHLSPKNSDILASMMRRSDNMMAEATLRSLCIGSSRSVCIDREKKFLEELGVNTKYARIYDGSGLSRVDRVTPRFMADLLTKMARTECAADYVRFFPIVGKEGTVKNLFLKSRLKGVLALKSGSLSNVQCYAGYKLDADNKPTHVVVIMVNDFFCPRTEVKTAIEKYLLTLF